MIARAGALALLVAVLAPTPATAQTDAEIAEATAVVMQQLDAFRRNDFDTAYRFASATIHQMFDRQSFERMVTRGYPEIARSTSAHVASAHPGADGAIYLLMKIRGANGNAIEAVYELVREGGSFRINSVVARPDTGPDRAASLADDHALRPGVDRGHAPAPTPRKPADAAPLDQHGQITILSG